MLVPFVRRCCLQKAATASYAMAMSAMSAMLLLLPPAAACMRAPVGEVTVGERAPLESEMLY